MTRPGPGSRGEDVRRDRSSRAPDSIRSYNPRPYHDRARDIFTRSGEGRRYERGIVLRPAYRFHDTHLSVYFPRQYCHYPYYSPTYWGVDVVVSPYHFYFGVVPGYLYRRYVFYRAPRVVYLEVPVYIGGVYRGYADDDYYLNSVWWRDDRTLDSSVRQAVEDLEDAFRYSDIEKLTYLTDPNTEVAVFTQGRYQYSLKPNDYLDMTRDFMLSTDTIRFDVFRVKRRAYNAYTLSAKHVYRGRDGETHTVYLSFALERIGRYWTITQVDTAPERL